MFLAHCSSYEGEYAKAIIPAQERQIDIQDIVNDMESDGILVTKEDIEDMYLNGDLF